MSSGGGGTSASRLKSLLDQMSKHCRKIHVAKKETSELADLFMTLSKRLNDRPPAPQQFDNENIESELVKVDEQLAGWSKFNYPKSLLKRKDIEAGVAEFVEKLKSIVNFVKISQYSATLPPEGGGEGDTGVIAVAGDNAGGNIQGHELPLDPTAEPETQPSPVKRLDREVKRRGEMPFIGGTYCEIWIGIWEKGREEVSGRKVGGQGVDGENGDSEKVALKALRMVKSPERARKRLERELPRWAELRHQNILPFYGIVTEIGSRLYMVSPWREKGNLLVYVKRNHQAKKTNLLRGSAAGLSYLHSCGLIHGSVKCNNVLVTDEDEPQICDFGISNIVEEANENTTKTVSSAAIVRYAAPEIIESSKAFATTESDTYSFAMLILECITEEAPFSNIIRDAAVIHARIGKKQCPSRPDGQDGKNRVSEELWDLMKRCWSFKPEQRPTMELVHRFFLDHPQLNDR